MTYFESLLALMLTAVVMLQVARRFSLPYPTVMAAVGVAVASIPGAPVLSIDPATALALFIAPVLVDAAFDFPIGAAKRLMLPLIVYAVVAVLGGLVRVCVASDANWRPASAHRSRRSGIPDQVRDDGWGE